MTPTHVYSPTLYMRQTQDATTTMTLDEFGDVTVRSNHGGGTASKRVAFPYDMRFADGTETTVNDPSELHDVLMSRDYDYVSLR